MDNKKLISKIGFIPKDNAVGVFFKKYTRCDGYSIEVDFENEIINYGDQIESNNKSTQNFKQPENWVVLECIDRLLEKGYKPQNIILEKTWSAGHGTSGRLDICVTHDDGSEYLLIECKTYGKEFDKALNRMYKDGGQLFTYFKFSNKADIIMLYASELKHNKINYRNEIVKIEDDYRSGDVKDFYEKWNKLPKDNGVFDNWVQPYSFESKALTINELEEIKPEDSSFIFNRFLEILRHNVVSDKPNAFNKIFTLFLCKIYDEKINEGTDNQLDFQWIEGVDDDISFQLRLTDLYKEGMWEFLEKKVTDFSEDEFELKYKNLDTDFKNDILKDFKRLRLEKNNEFAIKEVYDGKSFRENAKVVKQVVELLQKYKIRYAKKQQYLSDFFEMLLTTGLKQESGQFFTPVPIAQFIIKSLPIDDIVHAKLHEGKKDELLPYIIDYAAGSGHFITESMHEVQRLLDNFDISKLRVDAKKFVNTAQQNHFDWALQYVYGVEKDYRLVKVGKVGCYLHGDGLANVIHSDGLANFKHSDYKGKLSIVDKDFPNENKQFEVIVSNPPYSVSAFKNAAREYYKDEDFDLYNNLTDNSSEIECLFIERTKQLLKDGGVAGIILPSSILSNTGIYTRAREIILQYFEIISIAELGSNTFMATGTNTVVLFLRRRNNYDSINLKKAIDNFFTIQQDVTLNGIEKPVSKYINHVWEDINYTDYLTLLNKTPNQVVESHDIFKEYRKKIKFKKEDDFWQIVLDKEREKLFYFILAYPQRVVLIKSGAKDAEKRFLGYEFSNRRGNEGIHPIQGGKEIHECTQLFDSEIFDNPQKASTYIYKAFKGELDFPIDESMSTNVSRANLIDMLTFDRSDFEKNITLAIKKKVKIESKWELVKLDDIIELISGQSPESEYYNDNQKGLPFYQGKTEFGEMFLNTPVCWTEKITKESLKGDVLMTVRAPVGPVNLNPFDKICIGRGLNALRVSDQISNVFLFYYLKFNQDIIRGNEGAIFQSISREQILSIKIPLPPKSVQEKIVVEIGVLEEEERERKKDITIRRESLTHFANDLYTKHKLQKIGTLCETPMYGANVSAKDGDRLHDYRYIRITDINDNGRLNDEWVTAEHVEEKYILKPNDFLFARSGATAGKTFLYEEKYGKALFAGYLIKFEAQKDKLNPHFLNFILKSDIYKNWVLDKRRGAAQPNINAQQFASFEIPVPTINQQNKMLCEIEKLEQQISDLEEQLSEIPKQKEEVLKKYL